MQGDCDPFYPVDLSVEMAKAISGLSLWIVLNNGRSPVIGVRWPEFLPTAMAFLR